MRKGRRRPGRLINGKDPDPDPWSQDVRAIEPVDEDDGSPDQIVVPDRMDCR